MACNSLLESWVLRVPRGTKQESQSFQRLQATNNFITTTQLLISTIFQKFHRLLLWTAWQLCSVHVVTNMFFDRVLWSQSCEPEWCQTVKLWTNILLCATLLTKIRHYNALWRPENNKKKLVDHYSMRQQCFFRIGPCHICIIFMLILINMWGMWYTKLYSSFGFKAQRCISMSMKRHRRKWQECGQD